jgi:hypothetical protein
MNTSTIQDIAKRYQKYVVWSDEDGCYVGLCPGLFLGGCHGNDERKVFRQLCQIVEDNISGLLEGGWSLPPPTAKTFADFEEEKKRYLGAKSVRGAVRTTRISAREARPCKNGSAGAPQSANSNSNRVAQSVLASATWDE